MMKTARKLGLSAIALLTIASCGGGGGENGTETTTIDTQPPVVDTQPPVVDNKPPEPVITETSISGVLNADATTMSKLLNGGEYVFVVAYIIDENGNAVREDMARVDSNGNFTLKVPVDKPFAVVINDDVNGYVTAIKDASGKITTFTTNTETANLTLNVNQDLSISYSGLNEMPDSNVIARLNEDTDGDNVPDMNDWDIISSKTDAEVVIKDFSFNHQYEFATNVINYPSLRNSRFIRYHYFMPDSNPIIGELSGLTPMYEFLTCDTTYTDYKRFTGDIGIFLVKERVDYTGNFITTDEADLDELEDTIKIAIKDWNNVFTANNIPVRLYYGGKVFTRTVQPADCETRDTSDDVGTTDWCYTYADEMYNGRYNGVVNRDFRGIVVKWVPEIRNGKYAGLHHKLVVYPYRYLDTNNWILNKLTKDEFAVLRINDYIKYVYNYYRIESEIEIADSYTTHKHTMEHEIGHALGLEHPFERDILGLMKGKESIMNYGSLDYPRSYEISDFDAQVLREIYDNSNAYAVLHTLQDVIDFYNSNCNLETELNNFNLSVRIDY